jgi:cytochrome d ubiquinol oxidase subunit II
VTGAAAAAALLWLVIFVYALAGSIDFGATFWKMVFTWRGRPEPARIAEHYVSPLWEATNVFLVLVVVGLVGFFPGAAYVYGQVLLVPGSLILILLALRGALLGYGYAVRGPAPTVVAGLTALLLPALLVAVLPISQGGFVELSPNGAATLDLAALFGSPTTYAYLIFGLSAALYVSATFLSDYARTAGNEAAYLAFRAEAVRAGPVAIAAGAAALFIVPPAPWLQARLELEWPWFLASLAAFLAAISALSWRNPAAPSPGRPRWAVVLTAVQFALADFAYGVAHAPYLLFPQVTTAGAFTGQAMFSALLAVVVAGLAVMAPAFVWLWRLFVVDPRYTRA